MMKAKIYNITKWTKWNSCMSDAIKDFYSTYLQYPNILLANEYTFSQIDFLVNNVIGEKAFVEKQNESTKVFEPIDTNNDDYIMLKSFENSVCSVDFAVGEDLKDKEITLVFDDNPEWKRAQQPQKPITEEDVKVY